MYLAVISNLYQNNRNHGSIVITYIYIQVSLYIYIHTHTRVYTYIYIYVLIKIYIYIYISLSLSLRWLPKDIAMAHIRYPTLTSILESPSELQELGRGSQGVAKLAKDGSPGSAVSL